MAISHALQNPAPALFLGDRHCSRARPPGKEPHQITEQVCGNGGICGGKRYAELLLIPIKEPQQRLLGFGIKVIPSVVKNFIPFEKKFL